MKFMELFAGIGGFRRAALNAGWEPVGWAEIDKYARRSYLAIWPEAAQEVVIHDVTDRSDDDLQNIKIDVLMAGFPCQAFSVAGKRGGFEDTRGTLFFEVARYAKAMRPKWIIAENVRGLLNHDNGRTFRVILDTLNEIGYDVDFHVYNAAEFNVPQNRERVFIVAKRCDVDTLDMPIEATREPFEQRLLFSLQGNLFDDGVSFFPFP
jgi:DNA (cytosine-5)-methyltransferase 1